MKGTHRVVIQNKRIRYDFELKRNLTILRGDSATGKTTLIEMVQEYIDNNGEDSSIELTCDKTCFVLEGATWKGQLSEMKDSIVFIDEGNRFILTDEFAKAIQATDNYYVIASRESLPNLPYSVTEIYGIRNSGYYSGLRQHYNEFYRIYGKKLPNQTVCPKRIITEDSHAGYQFFANVCKEKNIACISSKGKSGVLGSVKQYADNREETLIIADGAAFGPEMDRVMKYISSHKNVSLYVPESFEWLILSANPLKNVSISTVLANPSDYIESQEYFSWERFFTKFLVEVTNGTYLQYSKDQINQAYLKGKVKENILGQMEKILL